MATQWNANGNWVLTASRDQTCKLFDVRMQREMVSFRGHNRDVTHAAWHPMHEDLFVSGGRCAALCAAATLPTLEGLLLVVLALIELCIGSLSDKTRAGFQWAPGWGPTCRANRHRLLTAAPCAPSPRISLHPQAAPRAPTKPYCCLPSTCRRLRREPHLLAGFSPCAAGAPFVAALAAAPASACNALLRPARSRSLAVCSSAARAGSAPLPPLLERG
jgi:hypothetical protein